MTFEQIIGQNKAKERAQFYFDAYSAGEVFPMSVFLGQRGNGKTELAHAVGLKLKDLSGGIKKPMECGGGSIKNLKQFWNSVIIPNVSDRDVTIFIDESHKLPEDVTAMLLTATNPNAENKNSYTYMDYTVDFDLRRQTFLFATTEPQKMFHALLNRCRRIDLEPYSHADLAKIAKKHCPQVKFERGVMDEITPTLRGNARTTVLMARDLRSYLAPTKRDTFTQEDWQKFSKRLDVLPLGLTRSEVAVLRILQSRKDTSLTRLAASLGRSVQEVRQDCELFLLGSGLMEITTGGRNITPQGQEILAKIEALDNTKTK
jgi:Holliday junction resolvasome RuvABC ATP-dependent DNA helicase subunit